MKYCTNIGIDAHSRKNSVCAIVAETGEMREATLSADPAELVAWIEGGDFPRPLRCCYEAGPTGFVLARALREAGVECVFAATSKLPLRVDRKKNDRVDAEWLARMLAAGSVRPARVPSAREESLCHLSRLRGETAADLRAARQRVASFLLLTGTRYTLTRKRWTRTFRRWAESLEFAQPADAFVFREKLAARMARLECIRGVGRVAAFSLVCEVHDFARFRNGAAFASFLGLVPSESSSGQRVSRGAIAKTGNPHLRRVLVEAASCYSRPLKIARSEDPRVPAAVRAKAEKCSRRLAARRRALAARGLPANKAKVAVARELAEWIYWIAVMPA